MRLLAGLRGKFGVLLAVACLILSVALSGQSLSHNGVQMATEDRWQRPGWWPTKGSAPREEFLGPAACEPCHGSKVQSQKSTPMANAASRPLASEALRSHDHLTFRVPPYTYQILRTAGGSQYSVTDGTQSVSAALNWVLGLGEAGQTYILERNGTFIESRVSYFHAQDGLDFTPGATRTPSGNLEDALGRRMLYGPETSRCFGCHTTASTASNRFDPDHSIPGVTCEACHGPGAKHVAAMKAGRTKEGLKRILDPGQLNPVDQVDFCGACHRTFADVALSQTFGILNLRFQPYRLEKSQCWAKSNAGITCLSCHNPHQSRVRDSAGYDDKCLGCHHPKSGPASSGEHPVPTCTVSTNNCVSCHMPKYEMPGMQFRFTDHFIRIVRKGEPYPD
jgi:hypothetical protein